MHIENSGRKGRTVHKNPSRRQWRRRAAATWFFLKKVVKVLLKLWTPCHGLDYSLNLLQNRLISVLKIGEKVYAMWLLYQNKNYSYCSCNPFIDNAPYWRECLSVLVYWDNHFSCSISSALDVFVLNILLAGTCGLYKLLAVKPFCPKNKN
jgi:hypothetical protein